MKKPQIIIPLMMVIVLGATAHATRYLFTDQHKHWEGWTSPDSSDNSVDVIGNLQLSGGSITIQNGHLTSAGCLYRSRKSSSATTHNLNSRHFYQAAGLARGLFYLHAAQPPGSCLCERTYISRFTKQFLSLP